MARKPRKVRCIETGEVYNSYSEAGKAIGINHNSVRLVVMGKQESIKGLHFEAVEEEEQMITSITNEQEVEVLNPTVKNKQGETVPVIDSREVARMMERPHSEILYYIEGNKTNGVISIAKCLAKQGVLVSDYFIESSYYTKDNRKCKC